MSQRLPPSASVARPLDKARMFAPAAERNAGAITELLRRHAPNQGRALELASGTGQHVVAFARALAGITWQPSEMDADRIASIDAYREDAALTNILPALRIDACASPWAQEVPAQDLIVTINIAHLVATADVRALIVQAAAALSPKGVFILYGPFKRAGQLTSAGDARFDADLRAANPAIGYKDDDEIKDWLAAAGLQLTAVEDMPANNLAFVATR